jgi:hypothetical protein
MTSLTLEHLKTMSAAQLRATWREQYRSPAPDIAPDLLRRGVAYKMQERQFGNAHVFDADLSDEEFAQIQQVDWELLPPGSADRVLARLASRSVIDEERLGVASERLRVLDRLNHDGFIVGTGRFARYFGARFGDRVVALENLEYGNALYVFENDWDRLTQLSRTDLIRRRDPTVHRVPHLPGWQSAFRKLVRPR